LMWMMTSNVISARTPSSAPPPPGESKGRHSREPATLCPAFWGQSTILLAPFAVEPFLRAKSRALQRCGPPASVCGPSPSSDSCNIILAGASRARETASWGLRPRSRPVGGWATARRSGMASDASQGSEASTNKPHSQTLELVRFSRAARSSFFSGVERAAEFGGNSSSRLLIRTPRGTPRKRNYLINAVCHALRASLAFLPTIPSCAQPGLCHAGLDRAIQ